MTRALLTLLLLAVWLLIALALVGPVELAGAQRPCVVRAELGGVVHAGTAEHLASGAEEASQRGCAALLVVLDTPGGHLAPTRRIVQSFLGAPVPVVVFVAPSGARAGSAGMFITLAAHVAAMTPASTIGAAHPVLGTGADPEEAGEHLARKVVEDVASFARGTATERGRNAEWAEQAVRESRSATAAEALALGVVDLVVPSEAALLAALDGREVRVRGRALTLRTRGARVVAHEMPLRQRVVSILADPNLAYVLLVLGMLGVFLELSNPGLVVPGTLGVVALLLAAIGFDVLPIDVGAAALLAVGVILLVAELFVTSYGVLLVAGVAALVAGSLLLIDPAEAEFFADPSVRVSSGAVIPMAVLAAAVAATLGWHLRRSARRRSPTGPEGLIGARGEVVSEVGPGAGQVWVAGESWRARAGEPIEPGRGVRVTSVRGLELEVEAIDETGETR